MKVLWHANAPFANTGYGQQTAIFAPLLREDGHEVAISAFYGLQGAILEWNGFRIYPAGYDAYGNDVLLAHAQDHFGGELLDGLIVTLVDVWVLQAANLTRTNCACWVPIDHDPAPPRVVEFLHSFGGFPIAMSRFGQRAMADRDIEAFYVPHGIDTDLFSPRDRNEVRDALGFPRDAFLVSMVAANKGFPPRKGFPEAIKAWAEFSRRHTDAILYLHTEQYGMVEGVNLHSILAQHDVDWDRVKLVDQYRYHVGMPADYLAQIYNASDVLLNPSYGEGFGIPVIEAQACGTPVITTNFSAMPELTGAGWLCEGQDFWTMQGSYMRVPSVEAIYAALEHAYTEAAGVREKAREFALQYDARVVMNDYWRPVLAEIESKTLPVAAAA